MRPLAADHGSTEIADRAMAIPMASRLAHLPPLPNIVRYHDDFLEKTHAIRDYPIWCSIDLQVDGRLVTHDFGELDHGALELFRHVVLDWLGRTDAKTVRSRLAALQPYPKELSRTIHTAVSVSPVEFRQLWTVRYASGPPVALADPFRALLYSLCRLAIGAWTRDHEDFVYALPQRHVAQYKTVVSGEVFIPLAHQALLVTYIDEMAARLANGSGVIEDDELRTACLLITGQQFGVRPGQTARLKRDDPAIHTTGAVHLRFLMTKQRGDQPQVHHIRRVTRTWCPLFIEQARRRANEPAPEGVHPESFFCLSPRRISSKVERASQAITGTVYCPNDFRHTGAQRLADAGASHEEIQEYLMHSRPRTAGVYFAGSATQAEKVNKAMRLSAIYGAVAEIARTKTIDMNRLLSLPADRQIGGVPHGIPIHGIGACGVGQPNCTLNPIFSCYGCHRFLPVHDAAVHSQVADDLRGVVRHFYDFEPEAGSSPAYGQLRHVIEAADRLAKDLRSGAAGSAGCE